MDIIVCCKQIIDPEIPPSNLKIDETGKKIITPSGTASVISPFDMHAVEAALRIKDKLSGKITILSLGNNFVREVVKKPLAMGADELILLEDEAFDGLDSWAAAHALAAAIRKIGRYDLILCGRQAADWDNGQVGIGIAEFLGIPAVTLAKQIEIVDTKVRIERLLPDGYETIETILPALITVTNELGDPRYASVKGVLAAKKKTPTIWNKTDISLDVPHSKLLKVFQPIKEKQCQMVKADNPAEAGAKLALKLREAKAV
ncbi:MAG: electron transfer flavoprotein subunit beta/FixA family protein [Candidatus Nealsonbacteria bacterium]|nr:electron transfer flavoprotein subunit beta/FixA family protein [Candidatus Nealsonbacteria bacterium]